MKRRLLAVALALVLAIVGTGLVLVYVKHADNRALAGQKAVTVLVASQLIPAGTPAATAQRNGLLQRETLPAESVPADAVRIITSDLAGLVASSNIEPGQLLLRQALVPASLAQQTGGIAVPTGMVAVTINLCLPEAVADYLHAGSQVAIFNTSASTSAGTSSSTQSLLAQPNCGGTHEQQQAHAKTALVFGKVQVLAVGLAGTTPPGATAAVTNASLGQTSSTAAQNSSTTTLVTLAVTPDQAKQLILLTVTGLPYLALLN